MKILIINTLFFGAGTEVQTQRELKILKQNGQEAWLLTFDPKLGDSKKDNHFNLNVECSKVKKVFYRANVNHSLCKRIKDIINIIQPDVIHINNLFYEAYSVLEACKGYYVVKTIRDPGLICPKASCLKVDFSLCDGKKFNNCRKCIGTLFSYQLFYTQMNRIIRKYKETVSRFICPSLYLSEICSKNDIQTNCVNNPFDFSIIKKNSPIKNNNFLYYGFVSVEKGVLHLLEAFAAFNQKYKDTKLFIAGNLGNISLQILNSYKQCGVEYLGHLKQNEIMELYNEVSCVVVPSLWLENYPNTVLEAIACKTMVIGSNRGGIPELIRNNSFLFDPLSQKEITEKLKMVYELNYKEYCNIVDRNFNNIMKFNSFDEFYRNLIAFLKKNDRNNVLV